MDKITVEKIKERINENLRRAKEQYHDSKTKVLSEKIEPTSAHGSMPSKALITEKTDNGIKSHIDGFLWKYGTRYAKIIKKIPVLKNIAEKHYWRLAYSQTYAVTRVIPQQSNSRVPDFIGMNWHYHGFLKEIKKEAIKGKVKLFIFKFIGFFATWQEQINRALYQELTNQKSEIEEKGEVINELANKLTALSRTEDALYQELTNQKSEIEEKGEVINELANKLTALSRTEDALYQELTNQKSEIEERNSVFLKLINQRIDEFKNESFEKDKRLQDLMILELTNLKELLLKKDKAISDLNKQLIFISRKLDLLNYELKKRAGLDISQTIKEVSNKDFSPESYTYFAFEDMFRGSREMIKNRQSQYLDCIKEAYEKSKGSYLLDIGCGRGEFLEILAENGIPSKGVDINEENINICKEYGFEVELIDALQFLKSIKNNSLIGITAFQVIEHLNTEYLIELIKASFQKIKDSGVVIFETVNPFSLYSLRNFFIDLTHRNPIPPDTLKFLVEASGFRDVEVKFSSPVPDEIKLKGDDENVRKLNEFLFGFQDYAIIGRK